MEKTSVDIHFKDVYDFRNRVCRLWKDQKESEVYDFSFENSEIENEFEKLMKCFSLNGDNKGQDHAMYM